MSTNLNNNKCDEINVIDLINNYNWSSTYLGPKDSWEPSFKIAVDSCLNSKFPTFIYCGPDLIYLYNQASVPLLKSKHPIAFGKSFFEVSPEHFNFVKSKYEKIRSTRKGLFQNECPILTYNNTDKYPEELYFNFAMSPIFKGDGTLLAIIDITFFTTHKVLAKQRLKSLGEALE
ncbi:3073_t:CDS:2, partial [Scutellospora calospora]